MWNEITSIVKQELDSREQLLWAGQPRKGLTLRASDAMMIPFSLLWGGFAIFWEYSVIHSSAEWFGIIWGIPFVSVGLYMIFGRFFFDSWKRDKTFYGVTDQRIIIVSNLFGRKLKSLNIRTLQDITLEQKSDESGTITFNSPEKQWWNNNAWFRQGQPELPSFEMIQEAKKVYEIIREAQRRAA